MFFVAIIFLAFSTPLGYPEIFFCGHIFTDKLTINQATLWWFGR